MNKVQAIAAYIGCLCSGLLLAQAIHNGQVLMTAVWLFFTIVNAVSFHSAFKK